MADVTKPAYLQKLVGDVRILVLGPKMLTDAEFDAHIAEAVRWAKSVRVVLLAVLGSPGMSAERRLKLARAGLTNSRTAVLTDSFLVRAILTAIGWLDGKVHAFSLSSGGEACEFLEIPLESRGRVLQEVAAMSRAVVGSGLPDEQVAEGLASAVERVKRNVDARAENVRKQRRSVD